jgi:hypothetical protein
MKRDACRLRIGIRQLPVQSPPDVDSTADVSLVRISHSLPTKHCKVEGINLLQTYSKNIWLQHSGAFDLPEAASCGDY